MPLTVTNGNPKVVKLIKSKCELMLYGIGEYVGSTGASYTSRVEERHHTREVWDVTICKIKKLKEPADEVFDFEPFKSTVYSELENNTELESWETKIEMPGDEENIWIIVSSVYYGYV